MEGWCVCGAGGGERVVVAELMAGCVCIEKYIGGSFLASVVFRSSVKSSKRGC